MVQRRKWRQAGDTYLQNAYEDAAKWMAWVERRSWKNSSVPEISEWEPPEKLVDRTSTLLNDYLIPEMKKRGLPLKRFDGTPPSYTKLTGEESWYDEHGNIQAKDWR